MLAQVHALLLNLRGRGHAGQVAQLLYLLLHLGQRCQAVTGLEDVVGVVASKASLAATFTFRNTSALVKKHLYLLLTLLFCWSAAQAANGDTTWVQANRVRLTYYNNYDTTVAFPSGAVSYRKVYMVFTLGKYQCPAGTQYCGDWDYTVQNFFMSPRGDTVELGRLITPYANAGNPRTPFTWKQRYLFDVTDYYPILRDSALMRIHYSGYSGGFTADVKFAFVEGTPERQVVGVSRLWHGDFNYGHGAVAINDALDTLAKTAPTGTVTAEAKVNVTGHGGDDQSCAEFCPNVYTLKLNGATTAQQSFFRDDCAGNQLYPQTGTWIYSRANWCPGAQVGTFSHTLAGITDGSAYTMGLTFPTYASATTQGGNPASYTLDGAIIYYGPYNQALDASITDIIAPTDNERHYRQNPTAGQPLIEVHNGGATPISTLAFSYGVEGQPAQAYTWAGTLAPSQSAIVALPVVADLRQPAGVYRFNARITQVNGGTDTDSTNDAMSSNFTAIPAWPAATVIQFRTDGQHSRTSNTISAASWRIEDMGGNIVKQRRNLALNATYKDTLALPAGQVYKLVVGDTINLGYYDINLHRAVNHISSYGLRGFTSVSGYLRAFRLSPSQRVAIPAGGTGSYEGNFGYGFTQYFTIEDATAIAPAAYIPARLEAYPNPASDHLTLSLEGIANATGTFQMLDMLGRPVLRLPATASELDIHSLPNGVYQVVYQDGHNQVLKTRVVVAR